jgi:putative membrane protein
VFLLSVLLTYLNEVGPFENRITLPALSLMGLALGIFLGFRNNTSYDRFWEGRKLWGALVNTSRGWARDVLTFYEPAGPVATDHAKQQVVRGIAFVQSLRLALRGQQDLSSLGAYISPEELRDVSGKLNRPDAVLLIMARGNEEARQQGWLTDFRFLRLAERLSQLSDIQGGCERILNTPIPHSYSILIHRIVAIYVFVLPFGLVDTLHYLTPLVVLMVAYTFLGLDAVGDEIEDPFGEDLNDLPLSTLSRMIEINMRQSLGETDVPEPLKATFGHYL